MADDKQDVQDSESFKSFFNLAKDFTAGSKAGARNVNSAAKSGVVTTVTGLSGVVLGAVSAKSAVVTGIAGVAAVLSIFTFNPIPIILFGGLALGMGVLTAYTAKGSAWLLGAAKGALMDAQYDRGTSPQKPAAAPAPEAPAPAALAAKPAANDFNRSATPDAATAQTEVKAPQPEQPRAPAP